MPRRPHRHLKRDATPRRTLPFALPGPDGDQQQHDGDDSERGGIEEEGEHEPACDLASGGITCARRRGLPRDRREVILVTTKYPKHTKMSEDREWSFFV